MACGATLKRSLDLDPLMSPSRSPKRRRCIPMGMAASPSKQYTKPQSPFGEVTPKLSNEDIAAKLALEVKRLQRRKQLYYPSSASPPASHSPQPHEGPSQSLPGTSSSLCNLLSPNKKDSPLFTFKQVTLVCERMLKEREDAIREEYDKVLSCKLSEQYEAFLKFNHDQLYRMAGERTASYVS